MKCGKNWRIIFLWMVFWEKRPEVHGDDEMKVSCEGRESMNEGIWGSVIWFECASDAARLFRQSAEKRSGVSQALLMSLG